MSATKKKTINIAPIKIVLESSSSPSTAIIASDASIKNNVTISILHMCYDSMLKVLSKELTLILSNTRELDRVPNTK